MNIAEDLRLGPYIDEHYALLLYAIGMYQPTGVAVEFGVGSGISLRLIAGFDFAWTIGFDSFAGLPADWREGFPKGMFACPPPTVPGVQLVIGLVENTLPTFTFPPNIGLVHFDLDLYESTATALKYIGPHLKPGCVCVFDEFHGYPGAEKYEQRAFTEYAAGHDLKWLTIGSGRESWAILIV